MATEVKIPEVGESVTSGVIATWTKKVGDYVERDEPVLELETDKITLELPSPAAGVLTRQLFGEGDEVNVGAVVGEIDESAEKPAGGDAPPTPAPASPPAKADNPAAETASKSGPDPAPKQAPAAAAEPAQNGAATGHAEGRATPLAKKLADENRISLGDLTGTGAGGRIREQDVLAAIQRASPAPAPRGGVASGPSRNTTRERMSPIRQKIASRLVEAQQTAAMLTTFNEVDMGAVMDLRKKHKEAFGEKHGIGLGFMSFFVKAVCGALEAFPQINSYIIPGDDGKPSVQMHDYADIAIAVSSPKGLVVPVLRNAEALSFAGVEKAIKEFGVRAKGGKIGLDEMQGGTFTITNGGVFGSLMSTPILNPPQSAILGMHGIKSRPAEWPVGSGQVAIRPMMYLALSYDHRVVDGAGAVQFLVHVKNAIEDPARLMLEL